MDMNLHLIPEAETHRVLDDTARHTRSAPVPVRRQPAGATAWYHDAAIEDARHGATEALANPYSALNLPQH